MTVVGHFEHYNRKLCFHKYIPITCQIFMTLRTLPQIVSEVSSNSNSEMRTFWAKPPAPQCLWRQSTMCLAWCYSAQPHRPADTSLAISSVQASIRRCGKYPLAGSEKHPLTRNMMQTPFLRFSRYSWGQDDRLRMLLMLSRDERLPARPDLPAPCSHFYVHHCF